MRPDYSGNLSVVDVRFCMYAVITVNVAVTPKTLDLPRLGDVSNSSEFDFKRQLGVYARSLTLKQILNNVV